MGWDVTVWDSIRNVKVEEVIFGFSDCGIGNIVCCTRLYQGKTLKEHLLEGTGIKALEWIMMEAKKGDEGAFTDELAIATEKQWDREKSIKESWSLLGSRYREWDEGLTYEKFAGNMLRDRLYGTAERFYTYLRAGYTVILEW